jgi:hypothetical protein
MAPMTFSDCWRTVRLYCPSAPTFLAREWVNTAWKQLLQARRWSFMRADLSVAYDGVSTTITMPVDFGSLVVVVDPDRQVQIPFWLSQQELTCKDPTHATTGPPRALVATTPSTDPLTLGQIRYEVYPSGVATTFTAVYNRQGARLDDTSVFTGVLADGGEVVTCGALMQAALWPGTGDKPNPYFNATLAQAKTQEFKYGVQMLSLRDDEQTPDDYWAGWPTCTCGCENPLSASADARATDAVAY